MTEENENFTDYKFISPAAVPRKSGKETHSGADVGIFAQGPWAHVFHGVHENIYIYHVMAYRYSN